MSDSGVEAIFNESIASITTLHSGLLSRGNQDFRYITVKCSAGTSNSVIWLQLIYWCGSSLVNWWSTASSIALRSGVPPWEVTRILGQISKIVLGRQEQR
jgi:hypothetical protein